MTIDYNSRLGVDIACVDDLDASLSLVDGQTGLAQHVARRITSPRGSLAFDQDYGTDVRGVLSGAIDISPTQASRMVEAEAMKDERVASAAAEVTYSDSSETLLIKTWIEDANGDTFTRTVEVSSVSVALLEG